MRNVNLRQVFETFTQTYEPARELMRGGELIGELKGAPLRFSLEGALWSRPGLLVTGEAAGSTYAFTGEGIGKAMETGLLAAEALLAGRAEARDEAATRADYETRLAALRPRFAIYERANRVNKHPWLVDLVVWSAKRSPQRRKRMEGVLAETHIPSEVASVGGVLRLLFDRR
jgi:flavin-dependent dehydrogenase